MHRSYNANLKACKKEAHDLWELMAGSTSVRCMDANTGRVAVYVTMSGDVIDCVVGDTRSFCPQGIQ